MMTEVMQLTDIGITPRKSISVCCKGYLHYTGPAHVLSHQIPRFQKPYQPRGRKAVCGTACGGQGTGGQHQSHQRKALHAPSLGRQ